jgi:hypothetical protein
METTTTPTPDAPPADTRPWLVGPLDRRQVAGFLAEVQAQIPQPGRRPIIFADVASDLQHAELYVFDRWYTTTLLGILLDHKARQLQALPPGLSLQAGTPGILPGMWTIERWATAPTRSRERAA